MTVAWNELANNFIFVGARSQAQTHARQTQWNTMQMEKRMTFLKCNIQ